MSNLSSNKEDIVATRIEKEHDAPPSQAVPENGGLNNIHTSKELTEHIRKGRKNPFDYEHFLEIFG